MDAAAARKRRLARLRMTAPPTFRLAVKPTRAVPGCSVFSGVGQTSRPSPGVERLRPRCARRKSARVLRRASSSFAATLVRPTVSYGHARGGGTGPGGPSWWTCAGGSRAGACERFCSADRCASRSCSSQNPYLAWKSRASRGRGETCQPKRRADGAYPCLQNGNGWLSPAVSCPRIADLPRRPLHWTYWMVTMATWLTPLSAMTRPL
jgi:hypothetical protein